MKPRAFAAVLWSKVFSNTTSAPTIDSGISCGPWASLITPHVKRPAASSRPASNGCHCDVDASAKVGGVQVSRSGGGEPPRAHAGHAGRGSLLSCSCGGGFAANRRQGGQCKLMIKSQCTFHIDNLRPGQHLRENAIGRALTGALRPAAHRRLYRAVRRLWCL